MVEESEERLSEEQIEELIQTVANNLPGDPEQENAAPAEAEMEEGGEQSWQAGNEPQVGNWSEGQNDYFRTGLVALHHCLNWSNMLTGEMHNGSPLGLKPLIVSKMPH